MKWLTYFLNICCCSIFQLSITVHMKLYFPTNSSATPFFHLSSWKALWTGAFRFIRLSYWQCILLIEIFLQISQPHLKSIPIHCFNLFSNIYIMHNFFRLKKINPLFSHTIASWDPSKYTVNFFSFICDNSSPYTLPSTSIILIFHNTCSFLSLGLDCCFLKATILS